MLLLTLVKAVPAKEKKKNWSELKSEWEETREVD